MAIVRIACAAAVLFYVAPHLGVQLIESARPLLSGASSDIVSDKLAEAAIGYCQKNPHACLKIVRLSLGQTNVAESDATLDHAELRSAFPDAVHASIPLPPTRPADLRPALK